MGWVCGADVLSGKATKKEIELHLLDVAEGNQCGRYKPQVDHIRYTDKVFETYEQAEKYVESFDRHDGNIVVKFKALSDKGEQTLKEKLKDMDVKISDAYKAFTAERAKLEIEFRKIVQDKTKPFITCPHCKSKLNVEVLNPHRNRCPLEKCNHILLDSKVSAKLLKTYESLKVKREEMKQKEYNKLMAKYQDVKTMVMANIYVG